MDYPKNWALFIGSGRPIAFHRRPSYYVRISFLLGPLVFWLQSRFIPNQAISFVIIGTKGVVMVIVPLFRFFDNGTDLLRHCVAKRRSESGKFIACRLDQMAATRANRETPLCTMLASQIYSLISNLSHNSFCCGSFR